MIMHPRTIKLAADGALEVYVYGDIVHDAWFAGESSARSVADILAEYKQVKDISVHINSFGGSAFDGIAIYNALKRHPANVTVHVDGVAASAASIVAMAGDTVKVAKGAMMMIHNASAGARGGASEMASAAEMLSKLDAQIAEVYAERGNKDTAHFRTLMDAETWLGGTEAVALGLADEMTEALAVAAYFDPAVYGYANAPKILHGNPLVNSAGKVIGATSLRAPATQRTTTATTDDGGATWAAPKNQPAPVASQNTKAPTALGEQDMKIFAKAAGLPDDASDAEIVTHVSGLQAKAARVEKAEQFAASVAALVGNEGDAALGAIKAHVEASAKLADSEKRLADIEAKRETDRHASLVSDGQKAGKLTAKLVEHFAAKSSDELEAFLAVAPKAVPVNEGHTEPVASDGSPVAKHNGKAFADMDGNERVALAKSDPELFASMNADFLASLS